MATPVQLKIYAAVAIFFLTVTGVFLFTAHYDRTERVAGWLVPNGGLLRLTARSGGEVQSIAIKEGAIVREGQTIAHIRLSPTMDNGQNADTAISSAFQSQSNAVTEQSDAARKKLLAEQADLAPKLEDLNAQLSEVHKQIVYQQRQTTIARRDLKRFKRLAAGGFISDRLVDDRRSAVLSAEQSLSQLRASALNLEQQAGDVVARQHAIPDELARTSADAASAHAQIAQQRVQSSAEYDDLIVASVSGRVLAIPVNQGQILQPGATVAIIAPKGSHLEAELYAPSRAVGFVKPGETVRLMYQAFPHEKFGTAKGTIISISRTILSPSEVSLPGANLQQPVFRVRTKLSRETVAAYGQNIPLQPGMLLTADIVFDRRTLIEWLFDPIYAAEK